MNLDFYLFNLINGLSGKWRFLDWLGIFSADYLGYFLAAAAVFLLLAAKNWRGKIYFFSLTVLSVVLSRGIVVETIRFFYRRPRPFESLGVNPLIDHDLTAAFPSGHAAAFFALAAVVFYCPDFWGGKFRNWKRWFLAGALLMGVARIFVGVHWPLDVLAGAAVGLASAFLVKKLLSFYRLPDPKKEAPIA